MDKRLENWCDQVIGEVRFWMDHNKIREELEGHIEDRCMALEELNYPPELAAERTLAAMGDPAAVGKALDREHSPWVGWLWVASIVAVVFCWCSLYLETYSQWGGYIARIKETVSPTLYEEGNYFFDETTDFSEMYPEVYPAGGVICTGVGSNGAVDIGDYIIEVHKAVWWRYYDKWTDVHMAMTVKPKKFWHDTDVEFLGEIQAVDSNGAVIINDSSENPVFANRPVMSFSQGSGSEQPFGSRRVTVTVQLKDDADWIEFSYPYGDNDWVIRVKKEAVE